MADLMSTQPPLPNGQPTNEVNESAPDPLLDIHIDLSSVNVEIPEIPLSGGALNDGSKPQQARPPSL